MRSYGALRVSLVSQRLSLLELSDSCMNDLSQKAVRLILDSSFSHNGDGEEEELNSKISEHPTCI